jgi:hypothetical protein
MVSTAYGFLPPEWNDPGLLSAVGTLQGKCGRWFEEVVSTCVNSQGLKAINSRKSLGRKEDKIQFPCGEIDLLAYSPEEKLLIVGESKMTLAGSEPKFFRDELEDFVRKEKAYANKFRRKIEWVKSNVDLVCKALNSTNEFSGSVAIENIAPVMVTFRPTIASYYIHDFPCVSLSEFMHDLKERGSWPYPRFVTHTAQ